MQASTLVELSLNEYQRRLHTYKDRHHECHALGVSGELAEVFQELLHHRGALDAAIAAGNVADMVKKATAHGVPLDRDKLKKELGDLLWYVTAVASDNQLQLGDIATANIEKLRARYPEGFVKGGGVRDEASVKSLTDDNRAHAVYFTCGCSETTISGERRVIRCPNGECQHLNRR